MKKEGTVVMAHCTCMAGLREVCSQAVALMYTVLIAVDKREGQACTEKTCTWTKPSTEKVKYDELSNIFANEEKVAIQNH